MASPRARAVLAALVCAPLAASLALLAPACTPGRAALGPPIGGAERELAVLFTGDSWGELEPCG